MRGQNILREAPPKTPLALFLEQLNDPLIFILFVAAAISMLLGEFSDSAIILTVIVLNATTGVIQEGRARKALEALKKLTSPKAVILEHGVPVEIPAKDLIPGDLVVLDAGRQVPADLTLVECHSLKIEESALTGESVPTEKDLHTHNQAFMSTNVTYGRGIGRVDAIGMDTQIGKIAQMINEAPAGATPLQKRLGDLGKLLSVISILLCAVLFVVAMLQHRNLPEMLITAISLAVAAVPEGLPAIVTMVLALSVTRMVKVNTIIRRLPSVETLGCVSVVCSDKTGTLTQNKMTVTKCYTGGKLYEAGDSTLSSYPLFLEGFVLCNDASLDVGDPTEIALLQLGLQYHLDKDVLEKRCPRVFEISFDSDRKCMTTQHLKSGSSTLVSYTKGAPSVLLTKCNSIYLDGRLQPLTAPYKKQIQEAASEMSSQALRVLALGMKQTSSRDNLESGLTFLGLVGMQDPLRPEAAPAVAAFREAGVRTIMITGDQKDTAFAIGKSLGLVQDKKQCLSGPEINQMSEDAFVASLKNTQVFCQVSPEHKVRIVKGLKSSGAIVAMTGDGVNDAPSLKVADVGIAMGMTGTDVAKNAADMVLTDDNFATIAKAMAQGRCIYANIKKAVLFLLSSNFGEIITMLSAILMGLISPLKPSHILWVNLITDSLPALALGVDMDDPKRHMKRPPRDKEETLFAHGGLVVTVFYGILIGLLSIGAFLFLPMVILIHQKTPITLDALSGVLKLPVVLTHAQTYAFTTLGISQLFHAIGMRDIKRSIFAMNHFANKLMLVALVVGIGLQVAVTHIPFLVNAFGTCVLNSREWILLIAWSAVPLLFHELGVILNKIGGAFQGTSH
ncbi:MAG: cation-translocating P-type ATPase [Lachnospiraceae bacterium]|nr:cation-translocating P-type ATPase [Lachnospiraceae bacterium]